MRNSIRCQGLGDYLAGFFAKTDLGPKDKASRKESSGKPVQGLVKKSLCQELWSWGPLSGLFCPSNTGSELLGPPWSITKAGLYFTMIDFIFEISKKRS